MISPVMLLTALNIIPDSRVLWFFLIAAPVIGLLMVSNVRYSKRPYFNIGGPFNALVVAAISFLTDTLDVHIDVAPAEQVLSNGVKLKLYQCKSGWGKRKLLILFKLYEPGRNLDQHLF